MSEIQLILFTRVDALTESYADKATIVVVFVAACYVRVRSMDITNLQSDSLKFVFHSYSTDVWMFSRWKWNIYVFIDAVIKHRYDLVISKDIDLCIGLSAKY